MNSQPSPQFHAYHIPEGSPLRNVDSFFWGTRINDEGVVRPSSFYALATNGQIDLYSPARAIGYGEDGRKIVTDVVILATGYRSSWEDLFGGEYSKTYSFDKEFMK